MTRKATNKILECVEQGMLDRDPIGDDEMQDYSDIMQGAEHGLGPHQIKMLEFLRRVRGWQSIAQDPLTQRIAHTLHKRVLIAALGCEGAIQQVRAYQKD